MGPLTTYCVYNVGETRDVLPFHRQCLCGVGSHRSGGDGNVHMYSVGGGP